MVIFDLCQLLKPHRQEVDRVIYKYYDVAKQPKHFALSNIISILKCITLTNNMFCDQQFRNTLIARLTFKCHLPGRKKDKHELFYVTDYSLIYCIDLQDTIEM